MPIVPLENKIVEKCKISHKIYNKRQFIFAYCDIKDKIQRFRGRHYNYVTRSVVQRVGDPV